ncbi:drug/metabolite transporter (DMT)-like permease [Rhodovulum sulfidophilum]|uniref:DMT family transporter n=1 Tax=Rhodovulum sulfidophilum TaxID=35806 RepID=UPI0005A7DB78|nr:DMT family transporter [Rhodovulum sulfidophilum]ANB32942.1 transporter [Rhodovulum sulfidophilum DSM 1374]ANB36791.1 transporter [Rhodovulum sulfidophilum]MCW2304639.1 drug/metabolite transporter (DMT)-like permease [Rhodovulum sulfidophilum]
MTARSSLAAPLHPVRNERLGIALRVLSTLAFAMMGVCVKALGDAVPLGQVVFFRSAVALLPLIAFLWWRGEWPRGLATSRPMGHVGRCLMGAVAMFTSFATIRLLPLAEATMLAYLAPVMLALLGWALLGERPSAGRIGGVVLGLAGAAAFCLPAIAGALPDSGALGVVLGLVTAALTAGALIQVRRLTLLGEGAGAIAFWFAVVSALIGLATLPWGWVWPGPATLLLLIGTGLAGGIAHILMTLSFSHADASALAPFEYLSVLWAVALGFAFFAELPGLAFLLAGPLILTGAFIARPAKPK